MFDATWSEIVEAPGEIYDVIEYKEEWEKDDKFDIEDYLKANIDYWCLSYHLSPILKWTLIWKCWCNVNN